VKKILHTDIIGKQGINLIEKTCLEMGFLWHPTGLEAGIDGYIEIRDQLSGEVTNCIVQVQSKATEQPLTTDSKVTVEYYCAAKDLDYWLNGNAPVILVRSCPKTGEAYWVSIKDYFSDPALRKSGKITFDKSRDKFDTTAKETIARLAIPANSGLYLGTSPKHEIIYSDLLPLEGFAGRYFVAQTGFRTRGEVFATLRDLTSDVRGEWVLHNRTISSFHDLSAHPWSAVCEAGTAEEHDTNEWAVCEDQDRRRTFVQLLNSCIREKLFGKGVVFSKDDGYYYVRASQDLSPIRYAYQSREKKAERTIFAGYPSKRDKTRMAFYRHSAFSGRFQRYGSEWFLQITPTYHFTRDGRVPSRFAGESLSGIKRLENNQAVHGQVVMWAHLLRESAGLFDKGPEFLRFAPLRQFQLDAGLEDSTWLKREEPQHKSALEAPDMEQRIL
jgi:hypothetical protein